MSIYNPSNFPAFIRILQDIEAQIFMRYMEQYDDVPNDITNLIPDELMGLLITEFKRWILCPRGQTSKIYGGALEKSGMHVVRNEIDGIVHLGIALTCGSVLTLHHYTGEEETVGM